MTFTVDVDVAQWCSTYGTSCDLADVRADVRSYFATALLCCPAVEEGTCDVSMRPTAADV